MKKKKVLKMFLCIMVIIFVVHMILSIWSASIVLKQIQIAQLCYIANCNIGESRNIYEENYFYDSKEKNHKGSTEEQQEIGYTLNDVTKRISYYPLKKVKITRISYLDKEISYLENEDGSIKIMYEENYPETKAEIYELPNTSDEEIGKLPSVLDLFLDCDLPGKIYTITHVKITEGEEDGIKCYMIKNKTNDGYYINYFDREGLCFKSVETKKDLQSGEEENVYMNTRKAIFNSVKPEDVAELNKNEYTIVSSDEFDEIVSNLL